MEKAIKNRAGKRFTMQINGKLNILSNGIETTIKAEHRESITLQHKQLQSILTQIDKALDCSDMPNDDEEDEDEIKSHVSTPMSSISSVKTSTYSFSDDEGRELDQVSEFEL